jgi:hypothetical protein
VGKKHTFAPKLLAGVSASLGIAAELWFIALGALILIAIICAIMHIIDLL